MKGSKIKIVFWNVDTQYDFMINDERFKGTLAVKGARGIEDNLRYLTKLALIKRIRVVNSGDWHTKDSKEISKNPDFIKTFPAHCLIGTKGAEFIPATNPRNSYIIDWRAKDFDEKEVAMRRNIVLYKDAFDVFAGSPHTEKVLDIIKPNKAIVYGVATNVCVDFAVQGLLERKVKVYVPLDAIKELPNLSLEETLNKWKDKGAVLTKTNEIERYL